MYRATGQRKSATSSNSFNKTFKICGTLSTFSLSQIVGWGDKFIRKI